MDFHICDKITWKESLLLLKEDLYAQRVYSTLWRMTKDVFYLALPISGIASLAILIPALISPPGNWWETSCVVVFVPMSFLLPLVWICAYFGWYKNLKKINSILWNFTNSLDEVDSIAQYAPIAYTFRYKSQQFQAIFQETAILGTSLSMAKGNIILAIPYRIQQQRNVQALGHEMASFLKGKNIPNFRLCENSMSYRLHYKPLPCPKEVKELMDLLIYLAHRFSLELITEEELYKEAMQEEKQNAGKAS